MLGVQFMDCIIHHRKDICGKTIKIPNNGGKKKIKNIPYSLKHHFKSLDDSFTAESECEIGMWLFKEAIKSQTQKHYLNV